MLDRAWTGKGTSLWQLCKASLSIILENSYWIPGNGKKINVWTNSILGQRPRTSLPDLPPLADWARDQGINSLFDLSCWDSEGRWSGWKQLSPPAHMENATAALFLSLHGLSPTSLSIQDRLGWGKSGQYNVKEGYKKLSMESNSGERIWKQVWHSNCIPKVNNFIWLFLHNKLLTTENLRKRGISSPSRCAMCNSAEETSCHIFLQCKVSLSV